MKKTLIALFMILSTPVFLGGAAMVLLPWKTFLSDYLSSELQANGLKNATLTVDTLGWTSARIRNLTFGDAEDPLTIPELTAQYDVNELQEGKLQTLTVSGIKLTVSKGENGWTLEGWPQPKDQQGKTFAPPVTEDYKNSVPAESINLEESTLTLKTPDGILALPLAGVWQKKEKPEFKLNPSPLSYEGSGINLSGDFEASLSLNAEKKKWEGSWSLKNLNIRQKDAQEEIAPADLSGTLTADGQTLNVSGNISGESKAYKGAFRYTFPFDSPEKAALTVTDFSMPWQDGTLSTKNMNIPLSGNKPYTLDLKVSKASIPKLMQEFTGEYVKGTGTISGSFPLKIGQDGKITIGKGTLTADTPGHLSMPPETIPGEGAQMQLTRDILQQFDYKLLSLTTEQDKKGLAVLLRLEGNNPKVENGRPVILNIRLTGDLLDFITSSAIVLTSPQTLIKQGNK